MSSLEGISPLSTAPPDPRPELDRARLPSYQLMEVYNLQEQQMVTPIAYRDVGQAEDAADPLLYERLTVRQDVVSDVGVASNGEATDPIAASDGSWSPRALSADRPAEALHAGASPASSSAALAEPAAAAADPSDATPLPYGADPVRIRQLVDAIAQGQAFVPLVPYQRLAGDLTPVKPSPQNTVLPRQVASVSRPF